MKIGVPIPLLSSLESTLTHARKKYVLPLGSGSSGYIQSKSITEEAGVRSSARLLHVLTRLQDHAT